MEVRKKLGSTEQGRSVPELRFSEFEGEWESYKLNEVTKKIQDGTHFSPNINEVCDYKYITSKNVRSGYLDLRDIDYISDKEHQKIYKRCDVRFGDILLTKDGANTGNACINILVEEFSLLSSVAFIRANQKDATSEFIFYLISSSKGQKEINRSIAGQAITRITLSKLRNYRFEYPKVPEQKKIASFLSAVDKKIQQLTRKKKLLEQYKKGVMQKIFNGKWKVENGKRKFVPPTLRFKPVKGEKNNRELSTINSQFSINYPDWEAKRLGEVGKFISGVGFTEKEQGGNRGIPFLKVSDMNLVGNEFFITKANNYVNAEQINRLKYKPITKDTLIFAKVGAAIFLERKRIAKGILIDNNMMSYVPCGKILFFKYIFETIRLSKYAQVGALPSYNGSDLSSIKINLPSINEQKKIASFLSSIDKKIESIQTQLTETRNFKKGLLQKLFV